MTITKVIDEVLPSWWGDTEVMENAIRTMRALIRMYSAVAKAECDSEMGEEQRAVSQIMDLSDKYLDFVETFAEGENKRRLKKMIVAYVMTKGKSEPTFDFAMHFALIAFHGNEMFHFADMNDYPDIKKALEDDEKETSKE